MKKSKKISSFIATLKIAYPRYFNGMINEDFISFTNMLEDMLGNYNEQTLDKVAKEIIKTKKYMPSMSEIIELCDNCKIYVQNEIVEYMIKDGYFHSPREIEKVYLWLEEGIIPAWLKEDMKKYYSKMIENKKLIEG